MIEVSKWRRALAGKKAAKGPSKRVEELEREVKELRRQLERQK